MIVETRCPRSALPLAYQLRSFAPSATEVQVPAPKMKTSRVSKDAATVIGVASNATLLPRRHTRSFAAAVQAFTAGGLATDPQIKPEDDSDSSALSSPSSPDIEDLPFDSLTPGKRKRGPDTPSTAITTISTSTSTRTSPRKAALKENGAPARRKGKRQPAKRIVKDDGSVEVDPPGNWEEMYRITQEMRKLNLAPVDTMGCERIADPRLSAKVRVLAKKSNSSICSPCLFVDSLPALWQDRTAHLLLCSYGH